MLFYLVSYPLLGAGIKYIDNAFDEKNFSKKLAYVLAPLLGILWAYTMIVDPVSATILLAVLLGVFLKGKIDNLAHLAGLLVILGIVFFAGIEILYLPLIILTVAAVLDEVGNDLIDKRRSRLSEGTGVHKAVLAFFDRRWTMKTAILVLVALNVIPWYFFVAMLFFDEAYILMRWISDAGHPSLKIRLEGIGVRMKCIFSSEKAMEIRPSGVDSSG
jgi:hypothetical protein